MGRIRPDVDIVMDMLQAVLHVQPESSFTRSLLFQYQERGGLSKKQLQGLLGKAQKIKSIPTAKLATLEAIILKKPLKEKSALPAFKPMYENDDESKSMIDFILAKAPEHKRVKYFQSKVQNHEPLSGMEKDELLRFYKLMVEKK
jgi:hypothetical protein